jgi:hypothetical protein
MSVLLIDDLGVDYLSFELLGFDQLCFNLITGYFGADPGVTKVEIYRVSVIVDRSGSSNHHLQSLIPQDITADRQGSRALGQGFADLVGLVRAPGQNLDGGRQFGGLDLHLLFVGYCIEDDAGAQGPIGLAAKVVKEVFLALTRDTQVVLEGDLLGFEPMDKSVKVLFHLGPDQWLGKVELRLVDEAIERPFAELVGGRPTPDFG